MGPGTEQPDTGTGYSIRQEYSYVTLRSAMGGPGTEQHDTDNGLGKGGGDTAN